MEEEDNSEFATVETSPSTTPVQPTGTKKKTVNKAEKKVEPKNGIVEEDKVDKKKKRVVPAKVEDEIVNKETTPPPVKKSKKVVPKAEKNSKRVNKTEKVIGN